MPSPRKENTASLVGAFKKSELRHVCTSSSSLCEEDIISLAKIQPSEFVVLFRVRSIKALECYTLNTLHGWLFKGNRTLPKSRAEISKKDAERVMKVHHAMNHPIPPPPSGPPPPPPLPESVTVRRGPPLSDSVTVRRGPPLSHSVTVRRGRR